MFLKERDKQKKIKTVPILAISVHCSKEVLAALFFPAHPIFTKYFSV
jgi:hypothetical protein